MKGLGIAYLLLAAASVVLIIRDKLWKRTPDDFAYWCAIALLLAAIGVYWLIWG